MKSLEEALAQGRAKKEAEERAHAEATAKAQEDAAKKEAIEAARRKVAEEKAKTEASWRRWRRRRRSCCRPGKPRRLVLGRKPRHELPQATAAAMEEAEAKLRHETPPGGSRVETLRRLFEGTPPPG